MSRAKGGLQDGFSVPVSILPERGVWERSQEYTAGQLMWEKTYRSAGKKRMS